jgi:hypothetical protein
LAFETGLRLPDTDNTSALGASVQDDANINIQKVSTAQIHGITIEQPITSDKVSLFFSGVGNCSHVSWLLTNQQPIFIAKIPKAHHGFHQCVHGDARVVSSDNSPGIDPGNFSENVIPRQPHGRGPQQV